MTTTTELQPGDPVVITNWASRWFGKRGKLLHPGYTGGWYVLIDGYPEFIPFGWELVRC